MTWTDYPFAPFNVNWEHPDGWRAVICLTSMGQFDAHLTHPAGYEALMYDSVLIAPAHGHEFDRLTAEALARFDSWIALHGAEALDDLPLRISLNRRRARSLLAQIPEWKEAALWDNLPLADALIWLRSELEQKLREGSTNED